MVEQQRQQFAHAKRPPNSPQLTTKVFAKITPDPDLRLQRADKKRAHIYSCIARRGRKGRSYLFMHGQLIRTNRSNGVLLRASSRSNHKEVRL